ncbi:MAG: methyltransferase domain-containing protein [Candidatus Krumholzibacteriia bacterium]
MSKIHTACVDLRDEGSYARERPAGAVRLELDDILQRAYLLPPRCRPLVIVGGSTTAVRPVLEALRLAGRQVVRHYPDETWREHLAVETGRPSRTRLWEAAAAVEHAVQRYKARLPGPQALDIACGTGRNAVYLALGGLEVTGVDVLADALERARDLATRHGACIRTLQRDLEKSGALHGLGADIIVVVRYLERSLFAALEDALTPGGILVYETFTEKQAAAFGHPRNRRRLLAPGELLRSFPHLDVLESDEGFHDGAHVARLIARRPESA